MNRYADANGQNADSLQEARCVALAQNRRGHGQSTLAWYLGRALAAMRIRTLIVDITGRHGRLAALAASESVRNLGVWAPSHAHVGRVPALLRAVRQQTRGKVDVILLDCDVAALENAGGFAAGVDYLLVLIDPTETGQKTAEHLAERLGDAPPPMGSLGVVFSRVNAPEAESVPQQTEDRHLPVLGYFPADYLLAGDESSQRPGATPSVPHDDYLLAAQRLARALVGHAQLRRASSSPSPEP